MLPGVQYAVECEIITIEGGTVCDVVPQNFSENVTAGETMVSIVPPNYSP